MTRINSAISVKCLTDEHLLAEHREIKRLPFCLQQAIKSGSINRIPSEFTLGKGHVLFFIDKMMFTLKRYCAVHNECIMRNFNVQRFSELWDSVPIQYLGEYTPTQEEHDLLVERITERILNSPKGGFHYYGKRISKKDAIILLNKK